MCVLSCLVMSNSLRPHELYPIRLLCPWGFPGKNTGVGCPGIKPESLASPALAGRFFTPQ